MRPGTATAEIFIYPGFEFQVIDGLLTNFHLPKSSLLMLVSAFAGRERVLRAYQEAVRERYRFYSYGDAMLMSVAVARGSRLAAGAARDRRDRGPASIEKPEPRAAEASRDSAL